jgi:hypothetical protein
MLAELSRATGDTAPHLHLLLEGGEGRDEGRVKGGKNSVPSTMSTKSKSQNNDMGDDEDGDRDDDEDKGNVLTSTCVVRWIDRYTDYTAHIKRKTINHRGYAFKIMDRIEV